MTGTYRSLDISDILAEMPEVAKIVRPRYVVDDEDRAPHIFRASYLPEAASSTRELALRTDAPIWDVNGYYRAIGITWPYRPTKREMRLSYQATGGPDKEYATSAFKRLLDSEFREGYDARPLGRPVDDKYRWLELRRRAALWAAAETARTGRIHSERDFIGEDLAKRIETDATHEAADHGRVVEVQPDDVDDSWGYGYYLWGSRKRDERTLSEWQSMMLEALWANRLRVRLAVGYVGHRSEPAVRAQHQQLNIVFLHEHQKPTRELAELVARSFVTTPADQALREPLFFTLNGYTPETRVSNSTPVIRDAESITRKYAEKALQLNEEPPMTEPELDFTSGGLQAAQIAKAEAAARKSRYQRNYITTYLADDGDYVYARFLVDEPQWIETKQHGQLKTKAAPKDKPADKNWPDAMSAVCRYTPVGPDRHPAYSECYACDSMVDEKGKKVFAGTRLWTLAALREPVLGTQEMVEQGIIQPHLVGQIVDYKDKTEEVDEIVDGKPTGKKVHRKQIVIVNMAQSNFFSPLLTIKEFFGTVLDRDFKIVRKGVKRAQKVQYEFVAGNPTYVKDPETGQPVVFDLRNPKHAAVYEGHGMTLADLRKHIAEQCSKAHYDRFFDPRVEVSWSDGRGNDNEDSSAATPQQPSEAQQSGQSLTQEPAGGPSADALAAMRAKLLEGNPQPGTGATDGNPPAVVSALG